MISIEELVGRFAAIPAADGARWRLETLKEGRLHLSRGPAGEFAAFVEGTKGSFGVIPPISGLEHSEGVVSLPSGRTVSALKILSDAEAGDRVIAHVAYELLALLDADPGADNSALLARTRWLLGVVGDTSGVLTAEKIKGLAGECVLLREVLLRCHALGLAPRCGIEKWWGHRPALRDFAGTGIAIEVKTTSRATRQHHIQSVAQLEPQAPGEEVFLFSVGLRTDPTAVRKLPHFIADVGSLLVRADGSADPDAALMFAGQLRAYGYDPELRDYYSAGDGFLAPHLEPALIPVERLERLRDSSFVGGRLPSMVVAVSYELEVRCEPLSHADMLAVIDRLINATPMTLS